ncbi:thioredoxin-disulfide reductase [Candidatus Curtissbacteria bacterium RIFOXYD1_FULL_41_36]|uniref:Thioredoxin reductase n=1 Tax=Candidatus Curtissbacteria bacterium RIFOXYA1_FULL_41_14 TaxID=1797737 RepID=A0A1F5HB08_9BACT|nr:MAG: Thioredoxin reductase [Microgenomates group bacterium GW2011_GWC1_40_35]KKS02089.1 MAG: Thioredoxin reductase [Candidatus Curtissbacteria bacterium GW2011_GWC2_41_21]OGD93443.1 MAG: thioredoxin-disulfide reductase [Candidatus Curtissbacteria bacterium RIFCSPHIGHO2_12_FULL_41_13]OGE01357.1 MAG: thioredoxin-disulfide reductase [Candidatus Curtissbacteria bacterium RIFOXYA1_FULL_41_14]OGE08341.1 MAG: thioredoxin-disulfide reductase [Candidatus Curtissbacteria bacterium RIFOXYD1_FULL_41_36]
MVDKIRNIIIIGSGPAGLTAALYNARANLNPLVIAGVKWGGQLMLTTNVENYPGFPQGILGPDLMQKFRDQAGRFGAEILNVDVVSVNFKSRPFKIVADSKSYSTKSVIVAAGAETNWLNLPNEQRLIGKGVSSCAPCDAFFFKDKKVIIVGGGDSAMEEALTLTKFATSVAIVHRRDEFRASKIMLGRARANKKISFIINSQVVDVLGRDKVEGVKIKNVKDGKVKELPIDGMFLAIGQSPLTNIFKGQIGLDERGYVKRVPQGDGPGKFQMTTSVEGVFVAGDVHDYHYRQAVTAAGYGCSAALEAEKWLEAQSD